MVAHPLCPCSRASVGELASLMTRAAGRLAARVVFVRYAGLEVETDLWRSAAAIPGVTVIADEGGREAKLFGAATSGQALLFDRDGRLLFHGGVTAARGHDGTSFGEEAILTLVGGAKPEPAEAPVYGCSLSGQKSS
jgi:hypothetical protein